MMSFFIDAVTADEFNPLTFDVYRIEKQTDGVVYTLDKCE